MKPWLLVALLLLAGCAGKAPADEPATGDAPAPGQLPVLSGWVLDAALAPIVGATIEIPGENQTVTTGEDGGYGFGALPTDRVLVVIARADGFLPEAKSITLPPDERARLNFSLQRVPEKTPYHEVQDFTGFMGCSMVLRLNYERSGYDCSSLSPQDARVWEFTVGADAKNMVIEVFWEPDTDLARDFNVTVETVGFGDLDTVLGADEAGSAIRIQVSTAHTDRFYREGGIVRVAVDIGRNVASQEAGSGFGLGFQQSFQVIATTFYVAPGPSDYSAA